MLLACTPTATPPALVAQRPVRGAVGLDATAVDARSGLLLLAHETTPEEQPQHSIVRQTTDGQVACARALDQTRQLPYGAMLRIVGDAALLPFSATEDVGAAVVRVPLDCGESRTLTSTLPPNLSVSVRAIVGDEKQVFVVWSGLPARTGQAEPLQIAAFDPQTGAQQWTSEAQLPPVAFHPWASRIAAGWLMFSDFEGDWLLLRRSDGHRDTTVVADPSGMCEAGGRWWARRDEQLLALDLRGDAPNQRSAIAAFVPPASRHQWSLADCAEYGDEVVLTIDPGPGAAGMLVGIDPSTMQARWTLDLPLPTTAAIPKEGPATPTRAGRFLVVSALTEHCTVDLAQHSVLGCAALDRIATVTHDGEDTLLSSSTLEAQHFVRIRGSDGKVTAAIEVVGARFWDMDDSGFPDPRIRGGMLWLHSPTAPEAFPAPSHVVLDARTLQMIQPQPQPTIQLRDMMSNLDAILRPTPDHRAIPPSRVDINPVTAWTFGGPQPKKSAPPAPPPPAQVEAFWALARERAELPADASIVVLARRVESGTSRMFDEADKLVEHPARSDDVLAVAEQRAPGGTRWVLLKGQDITGGLPLLRWRSFMRRPTESDIHRFLQDEPYLSQYGRPDIWDPTYDGMIDDEAWSALTGAPRTQQWSLPLKGSP